MEHQFRGKVALVTRAGQGLGRSITAALAKSGATVHAIARSKADLDSLKKQFPDVITHEIDISSWDKTRQMVKNIGRVDLLVNNSGILILKPFLETTKEDFARIFSTNVAAVYNVSQMVAKSMVDSGRGGAIVNVSSCAGARAFPRETAYCSSKAAVDMMTRAMAIELGKHKIRVNSVDPTITSKNPVPVPFPRIKHNLRLGRTLPRGFALLDQVKKDLPSSQRPKAGTLPANPRMDPVPVQRQKMAPVLPPIKEEIRVNSVDPTLQSDQHLPVPPPRIKHNLRMGRSATLPARGKKGGQPVTIGQLKTGTLLPSIKEMILPPPRKFRPGKRKGVPRGVFKDESDVVYAVMFLLSEDAGFITGTMLPVESSNTLRG